MRSGQVAMGLLGLVFVSFGGMMLHLAVEPGTAFLAGGLGMVLGAVLS